MKAALAALAAAALGAALLVGCSGGAAGGSAGSGPRTVDQIKESGTVRIGVFSDKSPFGYVLSLIHI